MDNLDFSNLRFNCTNLLKISRQNKKKVLSDEQINRLAELKLKESRHGLNKTEQKSYDILKRKFEFTDFDKMLNGTVSYLKYLYLVKRYGSFFRMYGGTGVTQMVQGVKSEPKSIELLQKYFDRPFYKHKYKVKNDKFVGKMDIADSAELESASVLIDVKTTNDIFVFNNRVGEDLLEQYEYQMQGYFDITGKDRGLVCFCLTDFTNQEIELQKHRMIEKLCPDGIITDYFTNAWDKVYASMTFKRIPIRERVITYEVRCDPDIISDLREKADICREWLNNFHEIHTKFFGDQWLQKDYFEYNPSNVGKGNCQ